MDVAEPKHLRRSAAAALLTLILAGLGCSRGSDGAMVVIPPPRNWMEQIAAQRAQREAYVRQSPDTPLPADAIEGFAGLDYWPPDERYYFVGDLHVYAEPQPFTIMTTSGKQRPCERYGWVAFPVDGQVHTLQVYRLLDMPGAGLASLLLPFRDATSGAETYPAGRYLDLVGQAGGPFVLDFNAAYNPSCAYGDVKRFACPVTPPENKLTVRVEAGERGFVHEDG